MTRIRLTVEARYAKTRPEGLGVAYIKQACPKNIGDQVGFALGVLYGPLQRAMEGGSFAEVDRLCSLAEISASENWAKARMIASQNETSGERQEPPISPTRAEAPQVETHESVEDQEANYIDFD